MKRVISLLTCTMLAACACSENQWEEVDNVTFDETTYAEPAPVITSEPYPMVEPYPVAEPAPVVMSETVTMAAPQQQVIVQPDPVYVGMPQPVYDCPCAEVQAQPCYQPSCMQPCACQPMPMPVPQPKVTTSKKIITTTTTLEEPCGKPVCEPVVTTHEEIIPAEVSYTGYEAPVQLQAQPSVSGNDIVEVTVEKNPYHAEVIGMKSANAKVDASVAAKYSPEAYIVVATRATNRMLQDTSAIYDGGKVRTIYIKDTKLLSQDLPYGSHRLKGATKDIISGSRTYEVVNNVNNADFVIDTSADWYVAPDNTMPALQYKLSMYDKSGKKVNEWVEIIRQVQD